MKRWIVLSLLFVPLLASAAPFWDGNAALQRGDASFESGLFATSNSFPAGTQITVQNQETGRTVTATITGRIEGQSDILVLLSPKAAQALGLGQGTLGRVRVTVPSRTGTAPSLPPGEQAFSSDPDVNPGAAYGRPDAAVAARPSEETLPAATPAAKTSDNAILANTTPSAAPEVPAEEHPVVASASTTEADNAAIISSAQSRLPQKQVFQPPREDQKFAYQKPVEPTQTVTEPVTPTITAVEGEPGVSPAAAPAADLALADVAAPEESRPEEIVGDGAAPPPAAELPQVALASPDVAPEDQQGLSEEPIQTEVTGPAAVPPAGQERPKVALLPPEAPAPPSAAGTQQAATTGTGTTTTRQAVSASSKATRGSFFLQLAAYGTEQNARDLAASLTPTYPAIVQAPSSPTSTVFKVVIGPLNRAESGTLLTWFRYRGFPDAFLKQE